MSEEVEGIRKEVASLREDLNTKLAGVERFNKILDAVEESTGNITAESISERQSYWDEHEGNVMGAKLVEFYQKNAPRIAEAIARTFSTVTVAFHGVYNADQIVNGSKYNWLKPLIYIGIPTAAIVLLLSNPVVGGGFFGWLGKGLNAYVFLIFTSAILFLLLLIMRRRQPTPVS